MIFESLITKNNKITTVFKQNLLVFFFLKNNFFELINDIS